MCIGFHHFCFNGCFPVEPALANSTAVLFVTVCVCVCVFVNAVNGKWLKLSTPDLVDIKYMAVARHAWTDL